MHMHEYADVNGVRLHYVTAGQGEMKKKVLMALPLFLIGFNGPSVP